MGRPEEAQAALREALHGARHRDDRQTTSTMLYALATVVRERGDPEQAGQMHAEALRLHFEIGDTETIARSLEGIAGTALDQEHFALAARLYAAGEACWKQLGRYAAPWPWEHERHQRDLARLDQALGAQKLGEAWQQGAARPLGDIVSYALRELGGRRGAAAGPAALTRSELEVARLAARGLTSREIAQRLFISPRTVESHLASTYRKLGIRSRKELRELEDWLPELARTSDNPSTSG
jgi:DNA-binding CsgD family transcriptional regulator